MGIINAFKNPYVGLIGSIASIISLILAVYFYFSSIKEPDLTYYIHPARAALVTAGNNGNFKVYYDKKPIATDVSAVTVAFWNAGNEAIRKEDVLEKLIIKLPHPTQILEAKIVKKSRDVISLSLDSSKKEKGLVSLDWNVLEENDGGTIQIIYSGGADLGIDIQATIVGQEKIRQVESPVAIKSASEQYAEQRELRTFFGVLLVGLGVLLPAISVGVVIFLTRKSPFSARKIFSPKDIYMLIPPVALIGLGLYIAFIQATPFPPFGF